MKYLLDELSRDTSDEPDDLQDVLDQIIQLAEAAKGLYEQNPAP